MALLLIGAFLLDRFVLGDWKHFISILTGVVSGVAIGILTERYTSEEFKHVQSIITQSQTGAATNILSGLSIGMRSTAFPVVAIVGAVIFAFTSAGLFGVALSALGMLATVGAIIAVDAYGSIADTACGMAAMAGLPEHVPEVTAKLDSLGTTTAATGKGFAIG